MRKMMNQLNYKQKCLIGIGICILVGGIVWYKHTNGINGEEFSSNDNLAVREKETQEERKAVEEEIVVYVTGAVKQEGVYSLKLTSRISDAIEKAGGLAENADIELINLAYQLEDGMKIRIPFQGEDEKASPENSEENESKQSKWITKESGTKETSQESEEKQNDTTKKNGKINLNTAGLNELDGLPGIGPAIAQRIIDYRKEKGKFTQIEQIKEVKGIGESKFEKVKDYICIK